MCASIITQCTTPNFYETQQSHVQQIILWQHLLYVYKKKIIHQCSLPGSDIHLQRDTRHIHDHRGWLICGMFQIERTPGGQMADHSDRSYFKTHVNNNSQAQQQQEWEGRRGSCKHSLFLWFVFNDDTGINITGVNAAVQCFILVYFGRSQKF